MSDWAMREYAEEDGFGRWPRRRPGGGRADRCRFQVRRVIADQQEHVRTYLELLRGDRPQGRRPADDSTPEFSDAESAFTAVAQAFGRRHGIDVETWVAVRVPVDVLRRAGYRVPDPRTSDSAGGGAT